MATELKIFTSPFFTATVCCTGITVRIGVIGVFPRCFQSDIFPKTDDYPTAVLCRASKLNSMFLDYAHTDKSGSFQIS